MSPRPPHRRRLLVGAVAGAIVLSACGGGDSSDGGGDTGSELPPAAAVDFLGRDLGGENVAAGSDIATNQFPDLVLDNLSSETKVNLKNIVPSDKPILLWMWAPH